MKTMLAVDVSFGARSGRPLTVQMTRSASNNSCAATNNVSIRSTHQRVRGAQAIAAARKVRIEQCRRQFVGLLTFMNASN